MEMAAKYGVARSYTDIGQFLSDDELDLVYIASPNSLHFEQAKMALEAGKHVLCEKPMCPRAKEVKHLADIASEKGLMLAEAVPTLYLPNYKALLNALPKVGQVVGIDAEYSQYSSKYDSFLSGNLPNVFNPEFAGGCLMDLNFYNIYLTIALFGKPQDAVYHPQLSENGIDISGTAELSYPGFEARLKGAKNIQGDNYYRIEGEKGHINITGGSNGLKEVHISCEEGEETINLQPEPDRWYYEIRGITPLLVSEDHSTFNERIELTYNVISLIEKKRKDAGIFFPGDEVQP